MGRKGIGKTALNSLRDWYLIFREAFFISRPLTLFARHTQTDTDRLPPRHAEAKTVNRFAIIITLMPERHLKRLPGQVAQAKNLYCLRMSV